MGRGYFAFKQFKIWQDRCAMKVTTDACIFGAVVQPPSEGRILDIGTGTGLLALMLAQRSNARIDAVELDELAAQQARDNVNESPWPEKIKVHQANIISFQASTQYDLVVCNPPFFANQLPSADPRKRQAWHQSTLSLEHLAIAIQRLLADNGQAYVLLPPDEASAFLDHGIDHGLYLTSQISHHSFSESAAHLHTLILKKHATTWTETKKLVYYQSAQKDHTPEAYQLLQPYYLYL